MEGLVVYIGTGYRVLAAELRLSYQRFFFVLPGPQTFLRNPIIRFYAPILRRQHRAALLDTNLD